MGDYWTELGGWGPIPRIRLVYPYVSSFYLNFKSKLPRLALILLSIKVMGR
ncbi:hypothetical protein PLAN_30302 [Planktothrix rubescens CCAP 1459/22]|uniref:Uncharacterized protein n=1 Tax=Planktothrix rubescens CCAP 1459/22 TaxID=329571 RepID=A0A6J7ZGN7_PLARU|nr:hypothetical protein PLAN_30302 [Planktothrix rubescens NIVA-CYA 18]